ncbi:MAG: ABC transporter substrate-binding protein/permease [Clostridia bacterium]|nr:ABC transporter substrate-binding protein/permease [Clostridia bacterium]MDY2900608.1 ABC transporter substrate-binding protein/permease [Christensenellaceae bacterium]
MKNKRSILLLLISVFLIFACSGCGGRNNVKLTYVDLVNNDTGFAATDADIAIAIGLKQGDAYKDKMNQFLDKLTAEDQEEIMGGIIGILNDETATFTPRYDFSSVTGGVLKVGMECAYEPYNWTQDDDRNGALPIKNLSGKYANGYDVQIAAMVAASMNMTIEIYQYEWESLIPAVQSGNLDAIVAGMSPTEERKKEVDFTTPYYRSTLVVVTREGSVIADAKSLEEIDKEGVKVAGQPGTFHLSALKSQTSNLTVIDSLANFVDMRIALEAGTIDGYVAERPTAKAVCNAKNGEEEGFFISVGNILKTYWKDFLKGVGYTISIALISTIAGLLIGLIIGIVRTIPRSKKKWVAVIQKIVDVILSVYIEVFRGTPMMVQSMVIYWGYAFATGGNTLNLFFSALVIVSINTGAYIAEIVRGGIISIDKGQFEGARALGMGHVQTMIHVILPQVIRNILPAVSNEFVINIKDTSVLNVIGVTELYFFTNVIVKQTYKNFPIYFICCVIYFIMTFTITRILRLAEKLLAGKDNYTICGSQTDAAAMIKVTKEGIPND